MAEIFMSNTVKEREGINTNAKPAGVKTMVKEKPMRRRVAEAFISNERGNIKDHVIFDVVIPAIKNALSDTVSDAINLLLFGERKRGSKSSSRTPYGSFWASSVSEDRERSRINESSSKSSMGRYLDACWESKEDANEVLNCMMEIMENYRKVTVADFYGLIDDPKNFPIESVHNKWGWKSLAAVSVVKTSNGYYGLSLPRPTHLD